MAPSNYTLQDSHSTPLLSEPRTPDDADQQLHQQQLYPPTKPPRRPFLNRNSWIVAAALLLIFIGLLAVPKPGPRDPEDFNDGYDENGPVPDVKDICAQPLGKGLPDDDLTRELAVALRSDEFLRQSAKRLTGAVRVRTESFDDMGLVGKDPRWDVFGEFHDFLEKTFPKMSAP